MLKKRKRENQKQERINKTCEKHNKQVVQETRRREGGRETKEQEKQAGIQKYTSKGSINYEIHNYIIRSLTYWQTNSKEKDEEEEEEEGEGKRKRE